MSVPGKAAERVITDTQPVAAVRCDRERRYVWVNATYARWVGRAADEIVGQRVAEVVGERAAHDIQPFIDRVLAGESVQYERLLDLPGLGRRWIKWAYAPTPREPGGRVDGWVAIGMDVHAQKEDERRKDEFLATLAHELRNPLAPIRNAVAILGRKGPQDPEVAWSQGVIERQIDQLARLIDDLLDIERISRGRFVLRKEPVRLETVVDMALEASRPYVNSAGHHLSVLLPSERVVIEADPGRMAHALTLLVKMATRRMRSRGSLSLSAAAEGASVLVTVEDSGGVQESAEPGIALTLVQGILRLHGATLELRTAAAGGSEALVRLPLSRAAPAAERAAGLGPRAASVPLRVLVADDNRDAADSLQRILAVYGHEVRVAYDGDAAVRVGDEFHPRVAILDIGMPGTNGYDVARALRRSHGEEVTLVALTGWGQEADRRRAADAGFDHHLIKPVDPHTLNDLLAHVAKK